MMAFDEKSKWKESLNWRGKLAFFRLGYSWTMQFLSMVNLTCSSDGSKQTKDDTRGSNIWSRKRATSQQRIFTATGPDENCQVWVQYNYWFFHQPQLHIVQSGPILCLVVSVLLEFDDGFFFLYYPDELTSHNLVERQDVNLKQLQKDKRLLEPGMKVRARWNKKYTIAKATVYAVDEDKGKLFKELDAKREENVSNVNGSASNSKSIAWI